MKKNYNFYKTLIKNEDSNEEFKNLDYKDKLWDLIVITAISAQQKKCYEKQIQTKLERNLLPKCFKYKVYNDPDDAKIGSGGSTFHVLKNLTQEFTNEQLFKMKILLIHAGGYSQRMPTCTVLGKIFSTVACESEYISDMLDLKLAIYTPFSVHMQPGLFLSSSDDFESFDFDEQIEMGKVFGSNGNDFILLAHKSPLNVGKDHGVYAFDEQLCQSTQNIFKCKFVVQKPSIQRMRDLGMVMIDLKQGNEFVFTDSAFYFSHERITSSLIKFHESYFDRIVSNKMEIDAYRDFLQPLGTNPLPKSDFLKSTGLNLGNDTNDELKIYESLHNIFSNRNSTIVLCKNSDFYHLGTVNELLDFYLSTNLEESVKFRNDLCFTRFKSKLSEDLTKSGCVLNSKISKNTKLNSLSLIEYCFIDNDITFSTNEYCLLNNCMVNNLELKKLGQTNFAFDVPANVCLHTIPIKNGKYLTIFFNRNDDLKKNYEKLSSLVFLGKNLPNELCSLESNLKYSSSHANSIWNLRIFRSYDTMTESFYYSLEFVNNYLNSNLSKELFTENVEVYSLFDILKIQDYEKMISFRIDNDL